MNKLERKEANDDIFISIKENSNNLNETRNEQTDSKEKQATGSNSNIIWKHEDMSEKEELHFTRFHNKEKSKEPLDVRYDVLNKNFIRTVKREPKNLLNQFLKTKMIKNSKNSFDSNNEEFVAYLLENTSIQWREVEDFDINTFSAYLMALTQYCKFKNLRHRSKDIAIKDLIFNLLYSYSHTRFYNFINTPEMRLLILILNENISIIGLINIRTSSNKKSYENHIGSLLKSIWDTNY